MLDPIIVVSERTPGVVGRIDKDALDLARELLLQRLEGEEIVAEDEAVIEVVLVRHPVRGVIRFRRVLQQDARLQLGPRLLPDPG